MEALGGRVGMKCRRWSPTAEQVKVLTALFRSGLRTPSTEQIRRISDHIGAFGEVESKNVFFWFQNHKARERRHHHHHKKRRRGHGAFSIVQSSGHEGVGGEARTYSHRLMTCDLMQEPGMWERPTRELETLELFPHKPYTVDVEEAEYKTSGSGVQRRDILFLGAAGRDDPPLALRLSCGGL